MNLINLSELYTMVSAEAPGLNRASALDHIREAARDFCDYSLVVQETIEDSIAIGDDTLTIRPSSSHLELKMVIGMETARGPIDSTTLAALKQITGWRARTGQVCKYVEQGDPGELRLYPISSAAEDVQIRIAVVPSLSATKIPKVLVTRHHSAIRSGALERILGMSGQTWSNPAIAAMHASKFNAAKSRARAMANLDNGKTVLTTPRWRQF